MYKICPHVRSVLPDFSAKHTGKKNKNSVSNGLHFDTAILPVPPLLVFLADSHAPVKVQSELRNLFFGYRHGTSENKDNLPAATRGFNAAQFCVPYKIQVE